jgi:hypothetical protein
MPITLEFRGVMLMCVQGPPEKRELSHILIPECEDAIPPFGSREGAVRYHLDGSVADAHYAGIMIIAPGEWPRHYPVRGSQVTIAATRPGRPDITAGIGKSHGLAAVTSPGGAGPLHVAATSAGTTTVHLSLTATKCEPILPELGTGSLKLGVEDNLASGMQLTIDDAVTIQVTPENGTPLGIEVPANCRIIVYNADKQNPAPQDLVRIHLPINDFAVDHDFKWLYSLLEPVDDTLAEWSHGCLPAPVYTRDRKMSIACPRVSTCVHFWIQLP